MTRLFSSRVVSVVAFLTGGLILTGLPFGADRASAQSAPFTYGHVGANADRAGLPDPFSDFQSFTASELNTLSGRSGLNLGDLAVNLSDQTAGISNTSMTGQFENGDIARNSIEQLSGINALMFNTGNNVNFQSSIQVNVFLK